MTTQDATLVSKLQASKLFREIPNDYLEKVAALCKEVSLPAQETIFEEYDKAREVYVILSGQVSLVICEPKVSCRQIAVLGDGDLVGWSPLVGRSRLSDTAVTNTPVTALVFPAQDLLEFCESNPAFGYQFMRQAAAAMAIRLSGTRLQLLQMCGMNFPEYKQQPESD